MDTDKLKMVTDLAGVMSEEEQKDLLESCHEQGWEALSKNHIERRFEISNGVIGYVLRVPNYYLSMIADIEPLDQTKHPRIFKLWQMTSGKEEDRPYVHQDAPVWPWVYHGYVKYDTRPMKREGHDGMLTFVPGYQGLNYSSQCSDGYVYGFNTDSGSSAIRPSLRDPNMIERLVRQTATAIDIVRSYEDAYMLAQSYDVRRKIINMFSQEMLDHGIDPSIPTGLDALINCITGRV